MRLLKVLVVLVILAFLALTGYAYLGDMGPRQQEMRKPVALDTGAVTALAPAAENAADEASAEDGPASSDDETAEQTDDDGQE